MRETSALIMTVPELRARAMDEYSRTINVIAAAAAARSGRDPSDSAVLIVAGAIVGVIMAATHAVGRVGERVGLPRRTCSTGSTPRWPI